jgi:hypothetical protein
MAKQKAISGALLQYPERDVGIEVIHRQKSTAYTQQQTTDDQDSTTAKDRGTTQTKISTRDNRQLPPTGTLVNQNYSQKMTVCTNG